MDEIGRGERVTVALHNDPDLNLEELMALWPETVPVFRRHGMLCPACPAARFFTYADACSEYGLAADEFREELSLAISRARQPRR